MLIHWAFSKLFRAVFRNYLGHVVHFTWSQKVVFGEGRDWWTWQLLMWDNCSKEVSNKRNLWGKHAAISTLWKSASSATHAFWYFWCQRVQQQWNQLQMDVSLSKRQLTINDSLLCSFQIWIFISVQLVIHVFVFLAVKLWCALWIRHMEI